ncbi:hypothetical protein BYT27DRAFT_6657865 [Phlegmacium glaucopus]|nr:hypothetical protein BYT27DRAFT_6657865 [Phlegmacium glaucopus]
MILLGQLREDCRFKCSVWGYKQSGIGRELGEYALDTFVYILKLKLFMSILDPSYEKNCTGNDHRSRSTTEIGVKV